MPVDSSGMGKGKKGGKDDGKWKGSRIMTYLRKLKAFVIFFWYNCTLIMVNEFSDLHPGTTLVKIDKGQQKIKIVMKNHHIIPYEWKAEIGHSPLIGPISIALCP